MKNYRITTESGQAIATQVRLANTFFSRLKGWMFTAETGESGGLLISPCNSVHTCFMRFSIDLLFLDKGERVVARYDEIAAWKMIPPIKGATKVLEIAGGMLKKNNIIIAEGDVLTITENN